MNIKPIIVFIDGPAPTEQDQELFNKLHADQFVNATLHGDRVLLHSLAAAVDPAIVPEGYRTTPEEAASAVKAPVQNPTAPAQNARQGTVGIQSDVQTAKLPKVPAFGVNAG